MFKVFSKEIDSQIPKDKQTFKTKTTMAELELNDGLFVYVLFTFQVIFVGVVGLMLLCAMCTAQGRHEIGEAKMKTGIKVMLLSFFCKWIMETYTIVE